MRVLGIDPGIAITGFGFLQRCAGSISLCEHGCIRTEAGLSDSARLHILYRDMCALLERCSPDVVAVEKLFASKNVTTVMSVSQARGVLLLAIEEFHLPLAEYTPNQVKLAVTGYGGAPKDQVQAMVKTTLGLADVPRPDDVADAIAVATCHLQCSGYQAALSSCM